DLLRGGAGRCVIEDLAAVLEPPGKQETETPRTAAQVLSVVEISAGASDHRPRRLWNHGREVRWPRRGLVELYFADVGAAVGADLAVRPRLLGQPLDGVVPVVPMEAIELVVPFGLEPAAEILNSHDESLPSEPVSRVTIGPPPLVVGRSDRDD